MTFEILIAASLSIIPACLAPLTALLCRFIMLTPSTISLPALGKAKRTFAFFPLSLPAITNTVSFFLIFILEPSRTRLPCLQDLGGQGYYLHEITISEFSCHRTKNAGPLRIVPLTQYYRSVFIKPDIGTVAPFVRGRHPDHHSSDDIPLLDPSTGHSSLHAADNDIAEVSVSPSRSTQYVHTHYLPSP